MPSFQHNNLRSLPVLIVLLAFIVTIRWGKREYTCGRPVLSFLELLSKLYLSFALLKRTIMSAKTQPILMDSFTFSSRLIYIDGSENNSTRHLRNQMFDFVFSDIVKHKWNVGDQIRNLRMPVTQWLGQPHSTFHCTDECALWNIENW